MAQPQKPEIEFPTRWGYKVIGTDGASVTEAVRECLALQIGAEVGVRDVTLDESRASAGGKYVSWHLQLRVESEEERDALFQALSNHDDVTMVI